MFEENKVASTSSTKEVASQNLNACLLHEMRNTLSAVSLTLQLISEPETTNAPALANRALKAVNHLVAVINSGLDLSSLQAGKVELMPTDIRALVTSAVELANLGGGEQKKLKVATEIGSNVPEFVMADSTRLRQVLINLLFNSIKNTPESGSIKVHVSGQANGIRFAVVDSGTGMSEEDRAKLFQPFSQAAGVKAKLGGTGLGLYISKLIVEALGGTIGVSSRLGQGSTFFFDLQLQECNQTVQVPAVSQPALPAEQKARAASAEETKSLRILIVDDDRTIAVMTVAILQSRGHFCRAASTVKKAIQEVGGGNEPFDVAFVDSSLGRESGVTFVEQLRALESGRPDGHKTRVIAMSGDIDLAKDQFALAGVNGFMEKPFAVDRLFAALKS